MGFLDCFKPASFDDCSLKYIPWPHLEFDAAAGPLSDEGFDSGLQLVGLVVLGAVVYKVLR